jgi:YidC/Oxa1 family membrane protein insertase
VETRALIAFVLSISILVGYQLLLGPRHGRVDSAAPAVQQPTEPAQAPPAAPSPPSAVPPPSRPAEGERLTIERDRYRLVLTSAGGRLESFRLNAYREDANAGSPALDMVH